MTHGAVKKKKQGKIVSLAELANIIGSTDPTVRKYIRDGMPQNSKGKSGSRSKVMRMLQRRHRK